MAVSQILLSKNDVNSWSIDDVTRWLDAAGLTKNAADLQELFIKQKAGYFHNNPKKQVIATIPMIGYMTPWW